MEQEILNRINKLKQDLTSVGSHNARKSEDLAAYLSQSNKKPSISEFQPISASPHVRVILEEKQARIDELEEEVSYLREALKTRELDMSAKYEKSLESIKSNCDKLIEYYEMQIKKNNFCSENGDVDQLLENIKLLEQENSRLKNEIRSQHSSFKKDRAGLEQEISILRDKALDSVDMMRSKEQYMDESMDIDELRGIKDKLEAEIANLQRNKSEYVNSILEEYDEKIESTVKFGKLWKGKADRLALEVFVALRNLKIEIFEIKNEILSNFENMITCASSIIARIYKKHKMLNHH